MGRLWQDFSLVVNSQGDNGLRVKGHWSPPRAGVFKINVDGALFTEHHCAGMGVMVRDCEGQAIAAGSRKLLGNFPVTMVEAMAVHFAMGFERDLGLQFVEVEGDSEEVINALNSNEVLLTPLGLIIEDIMTDAAQLFNKVTFSHVHHDGNTVAHGLARHAQSIEDLCVWI